MLEKDAIQTLSASCKCWKNTLLLRHCESRVKGNKSKTSRSLGNKCFLWRTGSGWGMEWFQISRAHCRNVDSPRHSLKTSPKLKNEENTSTEVISTHTSLLSHTHKKNNFLPLNYTKKNKNVQKELFAGIVFL
jgi:hypothetical protein